MKGHRPGRWNGQDAGGVFLDPTTSILKCSQCVLYLTLLPSPIMHSWKYVLRALEAPTVLTWAQFSGNHYYNMRAIAGLCNVNSYKISRGSQDDLPGFMDLIQRLANYTLWNKSSTLFLFPAFNWGKNFMTPENVHFRFQCPRVKY